MISQQLQNWLVCPACRGKVELAQTVSGDQLVCQACQLAYPVREDIPVMLKDEAVAVKQDGP
ncbi:MAG: Trm112 family protein [Desulfuromonadaceae bacterium]|nr:Trm112 family protein [Desulfuromonadaceae bacterium]